MKLKIQLDNLEGLDSAIAALYEEREGKYYLQLEGYEDPAALKRAKDHEKRLRKDAEDAARGLQTKIDELTEELEEAKKKKGKNDTDALEQSYKDKIEKLKTDHATELGKREAQISKLLVDNVAETMAAELSDAPELLSDIIRKRLVAKNGETRVLDANGELSATSVDELREEVRSNKKYAAIIRGSQASGGGSGGGGKGDGVTKPFKDMSEKERTDLAKSNPAEYNRQFAEFQAQSKKT